MTHGNPRRPQNAWLARAIGGPWAGEKHSLLLQLDDLACVSHVGLWCANHGATPKKMEICDARPHFPEVCAAEEPNQVDLQTKQAEPVVHLVDCGCGKSDDECHFFDFLCESSIKHMLLLFKGIHDSHYIGVNRLKLFNNKKELPYNIVAADGSHEDAKNVTKKGGWWAISGEDHFLALELEEATSITSIGLWCANQGCNSKGDAHL